MICYRIGSLLPEDGAEPSFAQVYVYDGNMQHQVDRRMNIMYGLDRTTLKALQMMLVANNPYVRRFLTAGEMARYGVDLHLVIHEDPGTDLRTHKPSDCEGRVVGYNESQIYTQLTILYSSRCCFHLANRELSTTVEYVPGIQRYKNKRMKVRDFYAYQLFRRKVQYTILHLSSRSFQQWCVEMYVQLELQRLRFIKLHPATLRADLYRGVIDAVLQYGNLGEVGRFVLLPPNFTGGERYMRKQYYDSMTIDDIAKDEILGKVQALAYMIEFQKRGLPHAHMTVKRTEESSPKRSEDYNKYMCAELPDPNLHPRLYETISKNMMLVRVGYSTRKLRA
ncbi:Helitron helicase [Phytophthora megakarya]|uniref:Helitron helicase n=1 Tax=Phytophthora megakarya TaxID=4795 RepID=A0A225VT74_9STRA|nr:Helitron helicase [Phytophthora megakarya]